MTAAKQLSDAARLSASRKALAAAASKLSAGELAVLALRRERASNDNHVARKAASHGGAK